MAFTWQYKAAQYSLIDDRGILEIDNNINTVYNKYTGRSGSSNLRISEEYAENKKVNKSLFNEIDKLIEQLEGMSKNTTNRTPHYSVNRSNHNGTTYDNVDNTSRYSHDGSYDGSYDGSSYDGSHRGSSYDGSHRGSNYTGCDSFACGGSFDSPCGSSW